MARHATARVRRLEAPSPYVFDEEAGVFVDRVPSLDQWPERPDWNDGPSGVLVRTLRELQANPELLKPPPVVVPRLAWAGRVTLLAAREKAGKSTLAGHAAAALSVGRPFIGHLLDAGEVLWVGLEEHLAEVVSRFHTLGADPDRTHVVDALPGALTSLAEAVEAVRPTLVVVDTLPALVSDLAPDSGSASQWTPTLLRLTALARESGAALLLLHHARKSDGHYRDSGAIGANADAILEMSEVEGDPAARTFRPKARWPMEPFTLRLAGDRYELGGGSVSVETLVLFYVQEHPGCSKRNVRDGVGRKAVEVDAALDRLLRQGLIADEGENAGHRYHAKGATSEATP